MSKIKVLGAVQGEFVTHTARVLEIAKALRETGKYEVVFSGMGDCMGYVRREGFPCVPTRTLGKREIEDSSNNNFFIALFNKYNVHWLFEEEDSLLKKECPEIVIRDSFRELLGIASKRRGIYDVFIQQANLSPYYHVDFRPINLPWPFNRLPEDKVIKLPFTDIPLLIKPGEFFFRTYASRYLHKKARELDLQIDRKVYEGTEADLVLIPDSEALFPLKKMKPKYKFIGPVLSFPDNNKPIWAESFLGDQRKKVVATCGSTGEHDKTQLFVDAFADGKLTVALHGCLGEPPGEIYSGRFDLASVLSGSDLFITHGGLGSTYLGLMTGVPMICLYNHFEQQANAMRIKRMGCGEALNPRKTSPQLLREKVEMVLADIAYKNNAMSLCERIREDSAHSLERAVGYIEEGYRYHSVSVNRMPTCAPS